MGVDLATSLRLASKLTKTSTFLCPFLSINTLFKFDRFRPESGYPAPYATVYHNMALLALKGFSSLPKNCLSLCTVFSAAAILINLIRDLTGKKVSQYVPIPTAMAIPLYMGPYFAIDMCLGSFILFVWGKINKAEAEAFAPAVASGLMCGDGLWALPSSILLWLELGLPFA
ncbi:unnamed protein product [Citrullus colocynthis]|uniref:Uncharacterized protein n=1 Tax=Citrullus colocynthis TaxID=252529 RepID=A0ABP0Z666_9ROSI